MDSFLSSAHLPDGLVKSKFTVHFPSVKSVGRSGALMIVTFGTIDMAKLRMMCWHGTKCEMIEK